jgi:hypothetical protein
MPATIASLCLRYRSAIIVGAIDLEHFVSSRMATRRQRLWGKTDVPLTKANPGMRPGAQQRGSELASD